MEGSIILLGHLNNGKSTTARKILAGNSKFYETLDKDVHKEKGTTIECGITSFLFGRRQYLTEVLSISADMAILVFSAKDWFDVAFYNKQLNVLW